MAGTLIEVLKLAESANLLLQSFHSGQNVMEDVYLQLLQEDQAHGFQRFDLDPESASDAVSGDPSS
jgi:hypothetical protein